MQQKIYKLIGLLAIIAYASVMVYYAVSTLI